MFEIALIQGTYVMINATAKQEIDRLTKENEQLKYEIDWLKRSSGKTVDFTSENLH